MVTRDTLICSLFTPAMNDVFSPFTKRSSDCCCLQRHDLRHDSVCEGNWIAVLLSLRRKSSTKRLTTFWTSEFLAAALILGGTMKTMRSSGRLTIQTSSSSGDQGSSLLCSSAVREHRMGRLCECVFSINFNPHHQFGQ